MADANSRDKKGATFKHNAVEFLKIVNSYMYLPVFVGL